MDEHGVERAPQPERAHVVLDVLALRVEGPAQLEHLAEMSVSVHVETRLQVRGVVPASGAELEERAHDHRSPLRARACSTRPLPRMTTGA